MPWRKYWQEIYLTAMVSIALAIIVAASYFFSELVGLGVIAAGVFVSVLGVGFYDQWHEAELAKARIRTRR